MPDKVLEQGTALTDPAMPLMSLPGLILESVSALSGCPPAIYSLGMTCVHMHGAAEDAPAQATTLLRAALYASLQQVLKNIRQSLDKYRQRSGHTLESIEVN